MISEAINTIAGLVDSSRKIEVIEIDGQKFANRNIVRVPDERVAEPKPVPHSTLRSLVAYATDDPDGLEEGTFLSVLSPTEVEITTPVLGVLQNRKVYSGAKAGIPRHRFGTYMSLVEMSIYLRTCFVATEERDLVVGFIGGVVEEAEIETDDDGIQQRTTVRKGISMKRDGAVPGLVELHPFRTFHDVEQPSSPFVLRLENRGNGVEAAVFAADGGAWEHEAMARVAAYLRDALGDSRRVYA